MTLCTICIRLLQERGHLDLCFTVHSSVRLCVVTKVEKWGHPCLIDTFVVNVNPFYTMFVVTKNCSCNTF